MKCPSEAIENVIRDRDEIDCEEDGEGDRQERVSGGEDARGATGMLKHRDAMIFANYQ